MIFRRSLFWDTNPKKINPRKHSNYIIEKIMNFGRDKEVRWMWKYYPKKKLRHVVKKSRSLTPKTKSLWRLLTQK